MENKIIVRRRKKSNQSRQERFISNCEDWIAYWRANPHRFITEYLGLKLYDFQKFLIYLMNFFPNFIYAASNEVQSYRNIRCKPSEPTSVGCQFNV